MRPRLLIGLATLLLIIGAAPASADCGSMRDPLLSAADARGTTFIGVYKGPDYQRGRTLADWEVKRVIAGDVEVGPLAIRTGTCDGTFLVPGQRYLFSSSLAALVPYPIAGFWNSVAWEVADDGSVRLAMWTDGTEEPEPVTGRADFPASVRAVRTLDEAIAQVAPRLPPTDTPAVTTPPTDAGAPATGLLLSALAAVLGAGAWTLRRRAARG
jgi:hypothetical protein